jgi:hypothetical protein
MGSASLERLWKHALNRAGAAVDPGVALPALPSLKMRDTAFALLHFVELLDGRVPPEHRSEWEHELALCRGHLADPRYREALDGHIFEPVETTASWPNLARAVRGSGLRALYAPGLAGVPQRAVVGIAFSLMRAAAPSRAKANEEIRTALARLEAGLWLAAARARVGDELDVRRAWWGAAQLALFECQRDWCLVRMPPGRKVSLERGARDDVLATIPDAHFSSAVLAVMSEQR